MWDCGHQLWDCHVSLGGSFPNCGIGRLGTEGYKAPSPPSSLSRVLGSGLEIISGSKENSMSDSESFSEGEPNLFDGESSDDLFDSDNEAVGPDAEDGSDTDVEILSECPSSVPTHGIGKGLMTKQPVPLSIVYSDSHHVGLAMPGEMSTGPQFETSTSDCGELAAEPSSRPRVSAVFPNNPRVPMGVPKEHLFGVDYLDPNKITEPKIAKYRAEYFIPNSVRMRIPTATESHSRPKEGEVVFFTDVLL
ncbi:unnamed protein product [Prunus brigantina]